jgi:hypothetical protein
MVVHAEQRQLVRVDSLVHETVVPTRINVDLVGQLYREKFYRPRKERNVYLVPP